MKHYPLQRASTRSRSWLRAGLLAVGLIAATGCLPEYEDPPLTSSGEAGESAKSTTSTSTSGSGTTTGGDNVNTSTCSGVLTMALTDSASLPAQPPCTVNGTVVIAKTPSAKFKTVLAQLKSINGTLQLNADVDFATYLPKLEAASSVAIEGGGNGKTLTIPAKLQSVGTFNVTSTGLLQIMGGNGLLGMDSLQIVGNTQLNTINGFSSLTSLMTLNVDQDPQLKMLAGFQALQQVNTFRIDHAKQLTTLGVFSSLSKVNTLFELSMMNLPAINQFPQLISAKTFQLHDHPATTSINFPKLSFASEFDLVSMPALNSLDGLPLLQLSGQVIICLESLPCATLTTWLQQHAPGKGTTTACGAATCKN